MPWLQMEPGMQAPHWPGCPHTEGVCWEKGTQTLPWQQPLGHVWGVQRGGPQTPLVQRPPPGHAKQACPLLPQVLFVCAGKVMHRPPRQQPLRHD